MCTGLSDYHWYYEPELERQSPMQKKVHIPDGIVIRIVLLHSAHEATIFSVCGDMQHCTMNYSSKMNSACEYSHLTVQ